jgi:hypothetical protein
MSEMIGSRAATQEPQQILTQDDVTTRNSFVRLLRYRPDPGDKLLVQEQHPRLSTPFPFSELSERRHLILVSHPLRAMFPERLDEQIDVAPEKKSALRNGFHI